MFLCDRFPMVHSGMVFDCLLDHLWLPFGSICLPLAPFFAPLDDLCPPDGSLLTSFGSILLTLGFNFLNFGVFWFHVGPFSCIYKKKLIQCVISHHLFILVPFFLSKDVFSPKVVHKLFLRVP